MANSSPATNGPTIDSVLRECALALEQVAAYRLAPALDRPLLKEPKEGAEGRDFLTPPCSKRTIPPSVVQVVL